MVRVLKALSGHDDNEEEATVCSPICGLLFSLLPILLYYHYQLAEDNGKCKKKREREEEKMKYQHKVGYSSSKQEIPA